MLKRKGFLMMVIAIMFIFVLAACSSNDNTDQNGTNKANNNENSNASKESAEEWDDKEADLVIYGQMFHDIWEERFGDLIEEKFPNYNIEFISAYDSDGVVGMSIEELIASGVKPDIYTGRVGSLQQRFEPAELHISMNERMERHGISVDDFEPQYFDSVSSEDGDIYMLPVTNDGYVMYYNEALFERFGIDEPTDGMSWEEAINKANEFTRNVDGKQYVGMWYSPKHILRVTQKSLDFVDLETNKPMLDTDDWHEWITTLFYDPMRNSGIQEKAKVAIFGHDDFRREDIVGMYVYTTGWIRNHQTELPPDWNIVSVPTFDHDGIGVQPYAEYFGLASTSETPDAAMRVLKYVTGEEFQEQFSRKGFMTPLKSQAVRDVLYADIEGLEGKNIQSIFYNDLAPQRNITLFDELIIEGPLYEDILPKIITGELDVNDGISQAMDISRQAIDQEVLRLETGN